MRLKHEFKLEVGGPFDFERTVHKPAGWPWASIDEVFDSGVLRTAIRLADDTIVGLRLQSYRSEIRVGVFGGKITDDRIVEIEGRIKLGFGWNDDLAGFYAMAKHDPLIKQLKKDLNGMRIGFPMGVFERALLAISLQMAPMRRSTQMRECLVNEYGDRIDFEGVSVSLWPSPGRLAEMDIAALARHCVLGYRAKFIVGSAKMISKGFADILELSRMPEERAIDEVMRLPGVGIYSAGIISPHHGFSLDSWSGRIFHEIIFGTTPDNSREVIDKVYAAADRRWGIHKGMIFVYVLQDLSNLKRFYPISRLT